MRPKADDICRIGFFLKGGVGDILVSLNFLQNLHRYLEGALAFDLYVHPKRGLYEIVQTVCHEQSFVKQVLPISKLKYDYDLYIDMLRYAEIKYFNESKIKRLHAGLHRWCLAVDGFHRENPIAYRYCTHGDFIGTKLAMLQGRNRLRQADIDDIIQVESVFRPKIKADMRETLAKFSLENKPFITMQRGAGGKDRNTATKLWPVKHYETLVKLVKDRVPETKIVQVGTAKNLPINGVDLDLCGKTSFEDVMVLMRKSRCHIDGECGLVHLRHFLQGGPSVVLFGPTENRFYGYAENINLQSDACIGGCEWITPVYTSKCPRGFAENSCLTGLLPEVVLEHVLDVVAGGQSRVIEFRKAG